MSNVSLGGNTGSSINFDAAALQNQQEDEYRKEEEQQQNEVKIFMPPPPTLKVQRIFCSSVSKKKSSYCDR